MNKRLLTATCAIALGIFATAAQARTHHHGSKHRYAGGGASTSRGCLTASTQALLNRIEARFGRVQIVSTCRPGARIAGTNHMSKHASGQAVDFNAPPGKKGAIVQWLIANHKSGGTMTYAGMNHIHVDVGYHFVSLGAGGRGGYRSHGRRVYVASSERRRRYASASTEGSGYYEESRSGLGMGSGKRSRRAGGERYAAHREPSAAMSESP
jgi:hypothetical protein